MNTQPRHPKCRALPVEPHPDIHFSAMIPRRGRKSKIFLSVVIPVVKATFMPLSATGGNPANAGVARLCGVSSHPIPDTATALQKLRAQAMRIFHRPAGYGSTVCKCAERTLCNLHVVSPFHTALRLPVSRQALNGYRILSAPSSLILLMQ